MALFGSSPLLLSVIAEHFFMSADVHGVATLKVTRFLSCLALVTGIVHLFGTVALPGHVGSTTSLPEEIIDEPAPVRDVNERLSRSTELPASTETSPLLPHRQSSLSPDQSKPTKQNVEIIVAEVVDSSEMLEVSDPQHGTALDLVKDPCFWALATVLAVLAGCVRLPGWNLSFSC
jgi:hypothetical protein